MPNNWKRWSLKHLIKGRANRFVIFAMHFAAMILIASSANGGDLPNPKELNIQVPMQESNAASNESKSVLYIDKDSKFDVLIYWNQVLEKMRKSILRNWPRDSSGNRVYGYVRLHITLRKDGYIEKIYDIHNNDLSYNPLSEPLIKIIKEAEPYNPFPSNSFSDYEFADFYQNFTLYPAEQNGSGNPPPVISVDKQKIEIFSPF